MCLPAALAALPNINVRENELVLKSSNISFEEEAVPLAGFNALHACDSGQLQAG